MGIVNKLNYSGKKMAKELKNKLNFFFKEKTSLNLEKHKVRVTQSIRNITHRNRECLEHFLSLHLRLY
jgi:hypothetical protein